MESEFQLKRIQLNQILPSSEAIFPNSLSITISSRGKAGKMA